MHVLITGSYTPNLTQSGTVHLSDLSAGSLSQIFRTIQPDILISTTSGANFELQTRIIDCAVEAQIPRFVPAEFIHDSLNPAVQERLQSGRERARTIEFLRGKAARRQISWCAISTGYLLDNGLLSGDLGFDFKWQSATIHGRGNERFAASSTAWIGKAMAAVSQHWEELENSYVYLAEMIVSADDIVEHVQQVTGQHWEIGHVDMEDTLREAERRLECGFPDAGMMLLGRSVLYDQSMGAVDPYIDDTTKRMLGLQDGSLGAIVQRVVQEYEHHGKGDCGCA